jgi:hypothetical protein
MSKKTPPHVCHAYGCTVAVSPRMFMCRTHWCSVRPVLRRAIWREYKEGQEIRKDPTLRYLAVQQRAVAEVAFKIDPEAAAEYVAKSEHFRQRAVDAGLGDPLVGLVPAS